VLVERFRFCQNQADRHTESVQEPLTGDLAFYLTKNQASLEAALPKRCAILCDNFASFSVAVFPEMFHIKDQKKLSRSTAI
jgi:hypothetical protein